MKFAAILAGTVAAIMFPTLASAQCMQTFPPCGTVNNSHREPDVSPNDAMDETRAKQALAEAQARVQREMAEHPGMPVSIEARTQLAEAGNQVLAIARAKDAAARKATLDLMQQVERQSHFMSGREANAANIMRNRPVGGASTGGFQLGTAFARNRGVGRCTVHFANNADHYYAVKLFNSGTCDAPFDRISMERNNIDTNLCLIPPHAQATLSYDNMGNLDASVLIAGADGRVGTRYPLNSVGCRIETQGRDPSPLVLNRPNDGDIIATR